MDMNVCESCRVALATYRVTFKCGEEFLVCDDCTPPLVESEELSRECLLAACSTSDWEVTP